MGWLEVVKLLKYQLQKLSNGYFGGAKACLI